MYLFIETHKTTQGDDFWGDQPSTYCSPSSCRGISWWGEFYQLYKYFPLLEKQMFSVTYPSGRWFSNCGPGLAAWACPGILLEMQFPGPTPAGLGRGAVSQQPVFQQGILGVSSWRTSAVELSAFTGDSRSPPGRCSGALCRLTLSWCQGFIPALSLPLF